MNISLPQNKIRSIQPLRFVGGVILVLAIALGIFNLLMQPSLNEISLMALFLSITSQVCSVLC